MEISEDCIRADVIGSKYYEVEIFADKGEVTEMYCSCLYAEDGNSCKHMAAVLYEWSDNQEETGDAPGEDLPKPENKEIVKDGRYRMQITEQDWRIFREKIPGWQEAYMEQLVQAYIGLLQSGEKASDKFWELEKRIKEDKMSPGVIIDMRRSTAINNILSGFCPAV